jgi:addiction module HigA family antidote
MMSKSQTTIENRLENPHPGADLRADLFEASGVTIAEAALATGLSVETIEAFLDGTRRVDADLDLRLGRYFGFSEGYFLRLQNAHDLEEARRTNADALKQIRPRAA